MCCVGQYFCERHCVFFFALLIIQQIQWFHGISHALPPFRPHGSVPGCVSRLRISEWKYFLRCYFVFVPSGKQKNDRSSLCDLSDYGSIKNSAVESIERFHFNPFIKSDSSCVWLSSQVNHFMPSNIFIYSVKNLNVSYLFRYFIEWVWVVKINWFRNRLVQS